jgi:hypothetical protein
MPDPAADERAYVYQSVACQTRAGSVDREYAWAASATDMKPVNRDHASTVAAEAEGHRAQAS